MKICRANRAGFAALLLLAVLHSPFALAQGVITSGETATGTISPAGDTDVWTFSAVSGQAIVLRVGEITQTGNFAPLIRLFSPSNVLVMAQTGGVATEIAVTAAATGTYTVFVEDVIGTSATGTYRLTLALSGIAAAVSPGDEGGLLTDGVMHTGTIDVGDLDVWTVSANMGDAIVARMGKTSAGSSLSPWLRLYSPVGALLSNSFSATGAEVAATAGATGTYVVVAGDSSANLSGSGGYRLTLARTGDAVTVSAGDEGGPLTNGVMHTGTIDVGDLDVWTLSAVAGEAIVVRMGETAAAGSLSPHLRLYSPTGVLLSNSFSATGAEVAATAGTTGTYLVVAGDSSTNFAGSGGYRLTLAKTGSAVAVSPGDEGGPMTNGAMHTGIIDVGDLDVWTVSAVAGEAIVVRMGESVAASALSPHLRLYSPAGVLLVNSFSATGAEVTATAGATGTYLVVAGDSGTGFSGSGSYRLTLAKTGSPVTVSLGDQGGALTNGAHTGFLGVGDLDVWTILAGTGDQLSITMTENVAGSSLTPWLRLYSPAGVLLVTSTTATMAAVNITTTSSGIFLLVAGDASSGFSGSGGYTLNGNGATGFPTPNLDVDLSITATQYDPLTDGLIVIRHLFGLSGQPLIEDAMGGTATRTDPAAIHDYLDNIRPALDIDGNGTADPFTDGVLIIRYLFGLRGGPLIEAAFDPQGSRTTTNAIENHLLSLTP